MKSFKTMFCSSMFVMFLLIIGIMTGCGTMNQSSNPGAAPDTTAPMVSSSIPLDVATGVAINRNISVTFSEAMDPATVSETTFTLKQGTTSVPCTVTLVGFVATLNPTSDIIANTIYTATITTGVKDLAGNILASEKTWSFTTGATSDTLAPTVSSTIPTALATGVARNGNIAVTFSEGMDPTTITTSTITLKNGSTIIPCAVTYVGFVATLNPTSDLDASTLYTLTITIGVKDLAGNALAVEKTYSFTTGTVSDTTPPTDVSNIPADSATGIARNGNIAATFSEGMDPTTINSSTFILKQGSTIIPCDVTYVGNVATLNPIGTLEASTVYTVLLTTGIKDLAGNALASEITWTFTTGAALDTTAPTDSSTTPADLALGVAINGNITATFSEAMDPLTLTTITYTLMNGATSVDGAVTCEGTVATFNPTSDLAVDTTYIATITTGAMDLAGNALAVEKTWSFTTTGAAADTTAPTVSSTSPSNEVTGEAINVNVSATFGEAMDPTTITTSTFSLKILGGANVAGAVTYEGTVATFNPTSSLEGSTTYEATISTGVLDLIGNALAVAKVWTFTTGSTARLGPDPVNLGLAGNYVILTKTGITTTGITTIVGDLGVSPAAATTITGFGLIAHSSNVYSTSSLVTGKVYAADYAVPTPTNLTTAISNLRTAYVDAAGRTLPNETELGAGDISNMTLAPGLYKWSSGVSMDNRGVTLSGGANDVWIFQIAGNLTLASGANVTLSGGAQAKNIFWQVGGPVGVTLGSTSVMNGIILATKAIVFNSGARLNGRALAETNVTLIANPITYQ